VNTRHSMPGPAARAWSDEDGPPDPSGPSPDDAHLLRQVAAGAGDAMAELYRRHGQMLFAQIRFMAGDQALSEEILQDTMLAIWQGAASFRGDSKPRSWMMAIAHRQTRDRLRHRRLQVVDDGFLAALPSLVPGPEDVALERVEASLVIDAIGALRPAHREVLGLAFGAGLALADIAEILEIPVGTVKSRISAAREALARTLRRKGYIR
jgi:RNA polymerase sigma-70 factor, ECF subfamily